jgi:hypothetical protein
MRNCKECGNSFPYQKRKRFCDSCLYCKNTERLRKYRKNKQSQKLCINCGINATNGKVCCDLCNMENKKTYDEMRRQVIAKYGSKCTCCKESRFNCLQIDHVNNNGASERKHLQGYGFLKFLLGCDITSEYQILCVNCNRAKQYYGSCIHNACVPEPKNAYQRWVRNTRQQVILHYGDKCKCCEESNIHFLELDHVQNDGNLLRKGNPEHAKRLWLWLKKHNYPIGYQILCANCNIEKSIKTNSSDLQPQQNVQTCSRL